MALKHGEKVLIHSLGDGIEHEGTVVGLCYDNIIKIYIVDIGLDNPWNVDWSCISVPEGCLRSL